MTKEDKFQEIINNFIRDRNEKAFLSDIRAWFESLYAELTSQGKTEEEIGKQVAEICYNIGKSVQIADENHDELRDIIASALLQFVVGSKYSKHPQIKSGVKK
jgi:hypothetical protein